MSNENQIDEFEIDLDDFDDIYVEGGADPSAEYDDCLSGACKL